MSAILEKMLNVSKWQHKFMLHVLPLFLSIKGRINFRQLSRYGGMSATCYRNNFGRVFDFAAFNGEHIRQQGTGHHVILFDPSHIRKSGKHTYGKGYFWSGCDGAMKAGLEIGGFAVGDVQHHTAFHYEAVQSPTTASLKATGTTQLEYYAQLLIDRKEGLLKLSRYVAVDAFFSKKSYVDKVLAETEFAIISRLRDDAVLFYMHSTEKDTPRQRGRPKLYDGQVNRHNPAMNHFSIAYEDAEIRIFSAVVYAKALDRKIKLALVQYLHPDKPGIASTKLYFCTDIDLSAWYIVKYYKLRFQIEFLFRDANQFTGLEHGQARSEEKIHFHTNIALTAVSIAKSAHYLALPPEQRTSFSMANVKTCYHNQLLLQRFFDVFAIDPNTHKNNPHLQELYYFGAIAA